MADAVEALNVTCSSGAAYPLATYKRPKDKHGEPGAFYSRKFMVLNRDRRKLLVFSCAAPNFDKPTHVEIMTMSYECLVKLEAHLNTMHQGLVRNMLSGVCSLIAKPRYRVSFQLKMDSKSNEVFVHIWKEVSVPGDNGEEEEEMEWLALRGQDVRLSKEEFTRLQQYMPHIMQAVGGKGFGPSRLGTPLRDLPMGKQPGRGLDEAGSYSLFGTPNFNAGKRGPDKSFTGFLDPSKKRLKLNDGPVSPPAQQLQLELNEMETEVEEGDQITAEEFLRRC